VTYGKVLVGTDGSETAQRAVRAAIGMARSVYGELLVAVAYDPGHTAKQTAWKVLDAALAEARAEGLTARGWAKPGDPLEVITEVAEQPGADLVVTGNKGMGRPRRVFLGSVPERLAHAAPSDLLIVRTGSERGTDGRYRSILVGTDGSPTATEAVRTTFALARTLECPVTVVHVGDEAFGRIVLKDVAEKLGQHVEVRARAVEGDPAERICDVAEEEDVDLIVVGNRGMEGAQRYLLPAIPNKVAHYATTDVLIVRTVGRSAKDLVPGEGGVVTLDGQRVAAYRDADGTLHAVSARCTHLGCTVGWNPGEGTWDCPCHGSRYHADGTVLRGPAEKALTPVDLSGKG